MRARSIVIVLCAVLVSQQADAQPAQQTTARSTEAECRAYVEEGLAKTSLDEARQLFHAARWRCANPMALIYIAHTYEKQGDWPRALAYLEQFLVVIDKGHESRAAMEQAAAALRERVPPEQRVNIEAELSAPPTATATTFETSRMRLDREVREIDAPTRSSEVVQTIERAPGVFVGANFAYATRAKVEISTADMNGTVAFPTVFAAELQAGYRIFPFLSVALASQMLFNLKPEHEDSAHELGVFANATGHYAVNPRWDLDLFVAPGLSVLLIPGADDAIGPAIRIGGGPMFHVTKQISFTAELTHQVSLQQTERDGGDVDMKTSSSSVLAGLRLRL